MCILLGAVYCYTRTSTTAWSKLSKILPMDAGSNLFGSSVAVSGSNALIGATSDSTVASSAGI